MSELIIGKSNKQTTTTTTSEASLKRLIDETKRLYATDQLQLVSFDERQLARPTFKFIQEIVKDLISKTRILRDVFSPADFDPKRRGISAANSDRHAKVEFVQKLLDFVAKNKHPTSGAVASKIVSGLDSVKANELLQNLARVALLKLNEKQRGSIAAAARNLGYHNLQSSNNSSPINSAKSSRRGSERNSSDVIIERQRKVTAAKELDGPSSKEFKSNHHHRSAERNQTIEGEEVRSESLRRKSFIKERGDKSLSPETNKLDANRLVTTPQFNQVIQATTKEDGFRIKPTDESETNYETLRIELKRLRSKLDDSSRIDDILIEKLEINLRRFDDDDNSHLKSTPAA